MLLQQQLEGFIASDAAGGRPQMLRTGAVGVITANSAGYLLTGFDDDTFAYLDAPMSAGAWYWEAVAAHYGLTGMTAAPATPRTNGGYSGFNAGIYGNVTRWNGSGYGAWSSFAPAAFATGVTMGFAYDAATRQLQVYADGVFETQCLAPNLPIYPMFAFSGAPAQQVRLGASCSYLPPAGYSYL